MKNLRTWSARSVLGLFVGLLLISVLTGCDTVKRYSIQSYQGPMPMQDQRYVENFH